MSEHGANFRRPTLSPLISFSRYVSMVRRWDRDSLVRGAGWASAQNNGRVVIDGQASLWLPWNIAGMAITAICRGTPHGPTPTVEQLQALVWQFSNIDDGILDGDDAAFHSLERLFHEQMPYQYQALNEMARTQALFVDTHFPSGHVPEVMTIGWVEALLGGVGVAEYSATGFILLAGALASNGIVDPSGWVASLENLLVILPRERIEEIALAHFVSTPDEVKAARLAVPSFDPASEKYAFNPLIGRPFVSNIVPDAWIAPSTDLVKQKLGVAGITFLGIDRWQTKFTRDLGTLFEAYVGRQLHLVKGSTVVGEIEFGTRQKPEKSIDWFLITESLVVLVEVKASSPTESIRQSAGELFSGVSAKLKEAVGQLNRSSAVMEDGHPAFSNVPAGRSVVGLVVTLGNYPSAGFAYRMGHLGKATMPIAFVSAGELEALVTLTGDELSEALLDGFAASDVPGLIENLSGTLSRAPIRRNEILDSAWLSNPVMRFLKDRAPKRTS